MASIAAHTSIRNTQLGTTQTMGESAFFHQLCYGWSVHKLCGYIYDHGKCPRVQTSSISASQTPSPHGMLRKNPVVAGCNHTCESDS